MEPTNTFWNIIVMLAASFVAGCVGLGVLMLIDPLFRKQVVISYKVGDEYIESEVKEKVNG